jgi:putative membrane protein
VNRVTVILLSVGTALFVALLAWQGFGAIAATLMAAGWGIALVAAFHLLPLVLDAFAIFVTLDAYEADAHEANAREAKGTMRATLIARWVGESVNSLLPAGQLGGPVIMVRQLAQRGIALPKAAAAIAVSTTMQLASQVVFAIVGILVFAAFESDGALTGLRAPLAISIVILALMGGGFYWSQKRGMFGKLSRFASRFTSGHFAKRDMSELTINADAIDVAVRALYRERRKVAATFAASLVAWIVGTGEVWLALDVLGHPVSWRDALLLESVGQAIRGAAFAIPGSLGAQEGGFLLLAPLVGLPLDMALALSLVKRARELALGLPGILYLHLRERHWQRHRAAAIAVAK